MSHTLGWVNGQAARGVELSERALQYGDGLFETIRINRSQPEFLERHIKRLAAGCQRLKFPDLDWGLVRAELRELSIGHENAVLKLILSRRCAGRGYSLAADQQVTRIVTVQRLLAGASKPAQSGIRVRVCDARLAVQPALAGIKHLNRLEQVLARAEWDDPDIVEGLMLADFDELVEGTRSNIFILSNRVLATPDLSRCGVAGVTRSVILDLARDRGVGTEIRSMSLADLKAASEVFVCNSVIGIWPVVAIDGMRSLAVGPLTRRLQMALAECDKTGDGNWYSR